MDALVAEITLAMPEGPFIAVAGFCLGGVAAWEEARQSPTGHPRLILVESPYHFPLVLAPILLPGFGPWIFRVFTQTRLGRTCIERVLFRRGKALPAGFWAAFGQTQPSTAQAYLKILKQYERTLPKKPSQPSCPCHRVVGSNSPAFLAWSWGRTHTIHAEEQELEGTGHFPASETPEAFFRLLDTHLSSDLNHRTQ
jgi:pimeloyl-ACP methyl ester carboxylesterase